MFFPVFFFFLLHLCIQIKITINNFCIKYEYTIIPISQLLFSTILYHLGCKRKNSCIFFINQIKSFVSCMNMKSWFISSGYIVGTSYRPSGEFSFETSSSVFPKLIVLEQLLISGQLHVSDSARSGFRSSVDTQRAA